MPPPRFIPLPPTSYALHQYTPFEWCQVRYVFARELTRPQRAGQEPLEWTLAYEEAGAVVDALQRGNKPLAYGARPGEVVWPTMLCYASRYSHMTPIDRAEARLKLEQGIPLYVVAVVIAEPDLCNREVLDDPEYKPYPPCVPSQVTFGVRDFLTSAGWAAGLWLIARTFADASKSMVKADRKARKAARRRA
jgi:hypothetical protein